MYRKLFKNNNEYNKDPNVTMSREYQEWFQMVERCYNEDHPFFPYYGAVGITVVDDWLFSFSKFLVDLKQIPKDGNDYFLKRIDSTKPYQKDNCVWGKLSVQDLHLQYNTFVPSQERINDSDDLSQTSSQQEEEVLESKFICCSRCCTIA